LLVDLEAPQRSANEDEEERAADDFALELLTGRRRPEVRGIAPTRTSARELARAVQDSGPALGIEPGVLAECYGHTTGDWVAAAGSLKFIYSNAQPVWRQVNAIARQQLDFESVPSDSSEYLEAILGLPDHG
jgi:hypothetical protein